MKTDNQPNDSVNSFDEAIHDLMKQSFATTDSTTKQITRVEKELFGGKEIVVQRNIEIPKIKGEKNADKAFQYVSAILDIINNKKISQEAAFKALQQSMKEKGRTRLLKTHTKRETNPALPGNVESRGCVVKEICDQLQSAKLSGGKTYVQPLLRLIKKWNCCDTFQLLDKEKRLEKLNTQKQELEIKKTRTPEEEKKLRKLRRIIPRVDKICKVHILANDNTEDFLNFIEGRPSVQTPWSGILGELASGDYV